MNRREFLKTTAAMGGALAAISALPVQADPLALQDHSAALVGDRIGAPQPQVAGSAAATVAASGAEAMDDPSAVVNVTIFDGSMKLDQSSVPAGPVTFQVFVKSDKVHEINVLRTQLDAKSLPLATDGTVDEDSVGDKAGELEDVPPDQPQGDTFDMTSGRYVIICNLAGHYANGEVATLVVK